MRLGGDAPNFVMLAILVNCVVIFLQESGVNTAFVQLVDAICIVIFIIEMCVKIKQFGFKDYWNVGMNRFDAILVLLSLPALVSYILPTVIIAG